MKRPSKRICSKVVLLLLVFFLSQKLIVYGETSYPPLWSYETGHEVGSVSISYDGSYVAAGSQDGKIYFFNRSGNLLWSYETGEITEEESVSISSNGSYVAAGSDIGKVYFLDRSGKLLWSYETEDFVESVSTSFNGSYVAAGSLDRKVYFFNRSGSLLWSYYKGGHVSISSDGSYVAAGPYPYHVYLFDRSGNLLWSYEVRGCRFSISSDGRYLAAGSTDHKVYLFSSPSIPPTPEPTPTPAQTPTPKLKPTLPPTTAILWLKSHFIEIMGTMIAIVTPFSAWLYSRRRRSRLRVLMRNVESTYREFRSDATKCEVALLLLKEEAQRDLLEGRITEEQFALIDRRIEDYLKGVRNLMNTEQ